MKKSSKNVFISKLMKLRNTDYFGDEAVAKYVINPGDVLIMENPAVSWLLKDFNSSYCLHCFKRYYLSLTIIHSNHFLMKNHDSDIKKS